MRLFYAFLADAAQYTPDGRLWVLGGDFDTIAATSFPARRESMVLVVKLFATPRECGREHHLRVELIDADGNPLHEPITLPFTPQMNAWMPHRDVGAGLTLYYRDVPLERPADLGIHVLVDDIELGTVPLYVVQVPAQERGTEP